VRGVFRMWAEQQEAGLAFAREATVPRNLLLRSLPWDELGRLSPLLHQVLLTPRRVLQHAGLPIEHVYFIEEGLVSVLAKVDERNAVEVGLIGRDGAVGSTVVLGADTAMFSHFVQIRGSALRIAVNDLVRVLPALPRLREALQGYLHLAMMQSAQVAACSLRHSFEQRLASWLLMAHERSAMDQLPITQDLLARSLGVRRPTVSGTFKLLEQRGVFAKDRGRVRILDRAGLQRIACRCYRAMCRQRDAFKRSQMSRKTFMALSLLWALFEIELAVQ
jgi:CRP-like cAMP-binding protein